MGLQQDEEKFNYDLTADIVKSILSIGLFLFVYTVFWIWILI